MSEGRSCAGGTAFGISVGTLVQAGIGARSNVQRAGRWMAIVLLTLASAVPVGAQPPVPDLIVDAPAALRAVAERVRAFEPQRLAGVSTLIGLDAAGPPVNVVVLPEDSPTARRTPPWVAAFADGDRDLVALFPDRIGSYPYDSLEAVLHHEVAHILIYRAAAGHRVPRWFNEGLASAAERNWGLDARSRLIWETLVGGEVSVTELEGLFAQGPREVARGYTLSDALVRDFLEAYGPDAAARLLGRMSDGETFESALYATTGMTASGLVARFWSRNRVWERWISVLGGPYFLWSFITLLALAAIWRSQVRRAERRRRWDAEERAEIENRDPVGRLRRAAPEPPSRPS